MIGEAMRKGTRPTFKAEFKLEAAQLVLDQGYSVREAATAMNVSNSAMDKWVRQLKKEREGFSDQPSALTAEQCRIKELEKRIKRVELENEILKKATALLASDALKSLR